MAYGDGRKGELDLGIIVVMPAIENKTPFTASVFGLFDAHAREQLVLVVSAAFQARSGPAPAIADEQPEIRLADQYRGDPAVSSILYPSDLALEKPAVDIVINGRAIAPQGKKTTSMTVGLRIADITKTLLVTGDRFWKAGMAGRVPSAPKPFESMPIIYERAFGGGRSATSLSLQKHFEVRNPVGVGIDGAPPVDASIETEVPNIEYASFRMDSIRSCPQPAGFSAVAPGWQPRLSYAGSYDEAWLKEQAPLLPYDFDARFYQVAPEDQQSLRIQGGELVEIAGMSAEGRWLFLLPSLDVPVHLAYRDRLGQEALKLDAVLLEPEQSRITLIARLIIPVIRNRAPLDQIFLGNVSRGWRRARSARKVYWSFREEAQ